MTAVLYANFRNGLWKERDAIEKRDFARFQIMADFETVVDSVMGPRLLVTHSFTCVNLMMTSSNGNIFLVTGHLCGEFTGHRWILHTKASDVDVFFDLRPYNGWVNIHGAGDLRRPRAHYDVTVMFWVHAGDLAHSDDAVTWKRVPHYWLFVWGIHWCP